MPVLCKAAAIIVHQVPCDPRINGLKTLSVKAYIYVFVCIHVMYDNLQATSLLNGEVLRAFLAGKINKQKALL